MTVKALATRCRELGAAELTTNVLTNIEVRRRDVSADELLVLALALDVAPVHLLTPPPGAQQLAVTPDVLADREASLPWIRGDAPLLERGAQVFLDYAAEQAGPAPRRAGDRAAAVLKARTSGIIAQYEAEAQAFLGKVRQQVTELVTYLEESVTSGVPAEELVRVLETVKTRVQPPATVDDEHAGTGRGGTAPR